MKSETADDLTTMDFVFWMIGLMLLIALAGCAPVESTQAESPWANVQPAPIVAPEPAKPIIPPKIEAPVIDVVSPPDPPQYGYRTERRQVGTTRALLPSRRQPIYADVQVWTGPAGTEPKDSRVNYQGILNSSSSQGTLYNSRGNCANGRCR